MATVVRRSRTTPISRYATLAAANDLDGVQDLTKSYDISGAQRVFIYQLNEGSAGTAGIDVVAISHDGGQSWSACDNLLEDIETDLGTVADGGALNAAGVEPTVARMWRAGPFEGPTAIRVFRNASDFAGSAAWVTGAPSVYMMVVGQTTGIPTALA